MSVSREAMSAELDFMVKQLYEEPDIVHDAIRALIEYRPAVSRERIGRLVQMILDEPYSDYSEGIAENCIGYVIDMLAEIPVTVEEGK